MTTYDIGGAVGANGSSENEGPTVAWMRGRSDGTVQC
jgi:hypothetical protein